MITKRLVLIIEDEEALSRILLEKLKAMVEVQVLEAKDGETGLKMALEYQPDLVLLDLVLPKMEGMNVLRKLREGEWGKNVWVIVLTNLSVPEKEQEARSLGVEDYYVKTDITLDEIVAKIKLRLGI
jgi:DNA-binding response OmpR family regulator